ncbi:predicted protein [Uncinocarpus reesii 1704]|uniref:Aminoglycoside phosphotransferase domain-containing protein n=1 Tax=Uncinocarpus reesii (strain UAMH 1704) TaxID=336963 RepID=C4JPT5_UNCRE|nr:uncharacterized protein UREG_04578 [Uncinocarpus reesii 1704]EEP79732.1 predicted protein [Uncinocarpus reesii 1704]
MLHQLEIPNHRAKFLDSVYKRRREIQDIAAHHLGISNPRDIAIGYREGWIHGSFNLCLPVVVDRWEKQSRKIFVFRVPLPYKCGELHFPGNAEEKVRNEVSTYIWMQENCPEVPIPQLWGFGFGDGHTFTTPKTSPILPWLFQAISRIVRKYLGYPAPSAYVRRKRRCRFDHGYMLLDHISENEGKMLSSSWSESHGDDTKRRTLFRDISRIMLSMARVPMARIGSFTIDNRGFITLTNRPLTCRLHVLEAEGIPTNIGRRQTYSMVGPYIQDLLDYHNSRIYHQPNSILDEDDGYNQMAALSLMQSVSRHFFQRKYRQGPFFFTLTDCHQSNIFVDENWNIRYLIDLEWACSLPVECFHPPWWLSGDRGVDEIVDDALHRFAERHKEFMQVFEEEALAKYGSWENRGKDNDVYLGLSSIMKQSIEVGNIFYCYALESTKGMYNIFLQHINSRFSKDPQSLPKEADLDDVGWLYLSRAVAPYWDPKAHQILAAKLDEKKVYEKQIRVLFEEADLPSRDGPPLSVATAGNDDNVENRNRSDVS